jgi:hypothetical protein
MADADGGRSVIASAYWRKALPFAGTLIIFALIFWRIPAARLGAALERIPVLKFFGIFLPFSLCYWVIDSFCLTWVVRRFNAEVRLRDVMPIRASMNLLALINSNLGQGGVAWYLHRKTGVQFLQVLSSILFIVLMEIYQLLFFSTLGVLFYRPQSLAQSRVVHVLRSADVAAWLLLAAIIALFAQARRNENAGAWIASSRLGSIAGTFVAARPIDYAIVLGIKAPNFILSVVTHSFALALFGIAIPMARLMLFLPLVFVAAALPIAVAHLGTSQAAWLLFFSGTAPDADILAYSLAAHFTFMLCNGLIGLFYLPRASRELSALETAET